ncbi:MAG: D-sedoheptulose 7-phosphate isomerase [Candidatus Omnitrophota bacterium]|nr:D-sedoheptulose 7-phosphate isomerase [Candidatus Omnitrophota bacterium]
MKKKIVKLLKESIEVKNKLLESQIGEIEKLASAMLKTLKSGSKILLFGNGGSAADSMHIAAELVGRFKKERKALPAIALTANISTLTALGNDYNFEYIFERQVEAFGNKGDMAIGISTSGDSRNVVAGILKASKMGLKTAALTGEKKGGLFKAADIIVRVPSINTPRIQEAHIAIGHIVCELIEDAF